MPFVNVGMGKGSDDIANTVKYQVSIGKFKMLLIFERNNASTKTLYRNIHLRHPIYQTKLYVHTCNKHAWREGGSLKFHFKLWKRELYYRDSITFCNSSIESFEDNYMLTTYP